MAKEITLNHITKIEGHASLKLGIDKGKITVCELGATEGSRYFEGLVRGRQYYEAQEMTSRICGICSTGHVMAAVQAVENAIGFIPTEGIQQLRVLQTLGERIRSHATHLYFLALPDYLGYESGLAMAGKYKAEVQSALRMMKVGNRIVSIVGGRDLHPVSTAVGGWLHWPSTDDFKEMEKSLREIKKDAIATAELFMTLKNPDFESDGKWFSLTDAHEYAVLGGTFAGENGERFDKEHYRDFLREYHQPYSTANFVVKDEHAYMTHALSRLNNNAHQLSADAKKMLKKSGLKLPSTNPFHNNLAQAIDLVHAVDHALQIAKKPISAEPFERPRPRAGTGVGAVEVPRGVLWHEYTIDDNGVITNANIITPTAQNLLNMQEDVRKHVGTITTKSKEHIILEVEKLIRNYDPCFSCSAHFLDVKWV